tara:strand:- start:361 stop:591 length:231 start_codon:yes stop_codon:yes gene_type:complete
MIYVLLLVLLYLLYINTIENREHFATSSKQTKINNINASVRTLSANIKDLASISKHNTTQICKIRKAMEQAKFSGS